MAIKTLSVRQFAAVKRVAQNVNPLVVKKNKIIAKVYELEAELQDIRAEIDGHEAGIKALTGGHSSEELVTKIVKTKLDKNGNTIKEVKYEPTDMVVYNAETGAYDIISVEENNTEESENNNEFNF